MFDGETAFTLYDTYGFPLDLTQDALRARGIGVDLAAFNDAMERQREKARASWAGSGEAATETVWFSLREKLGATEFLGYETESAEGVVAALVRDGKEVAELEERRDRRGRAEPDAVLWRVAAARSAIPARCARDGVRLARHRHAEEGRRPVRASGHGRGGHAQGRRPRCCSKSITRAAAPSATTIPPRICCTRRCARCSAITSRRRARWSRPTGCASTSRIPSRSRPRSSRRVEDIANDIVLQNSPVTTRLMALDDARASGARALFGEKYGDEVRVVAMGEGSGNTLGWSVELCGGTHVRRTGDIGLISVVGDAGSRPACAGIEALDRQSRAQDRQHTDSSR